MTRRCNLDPSIVRAVAEAVQGVGGDLADVEDLLDVWIRVAKNTNCRADVMRREAKELREREAADDDEADGEPSR